LVARLIDRARSAAGPGGSGAAIAVALVLVAGAGFSFYLAGSNLLGCGRIYAGHEIYVWLALSAVQSLLFLAAPLADRARRAYRLTQYAMLLPLALVLVQLASAYPGAFVCLALLAAGYWTVIAARHQLRAGGAWMVEPGALGAAAAETTAFVLATVVIHSALAFVILTTPGARLGGATFLAILAVAGVLAGLLVRRDGRFAPFSIASVPPLALLLLVLLRAKFPDEAYDSLFYKATLPIMIADWRTAVTGILDHALLGTDLFEIVNSQLRVADRDYPPALTAAFAFAGMWILVPVAARLAMPRALAAGQGFAINACALLAVSICEPLVAAGTAYHEPLLALLLVASLLPLAAGWLFLGAAVAGKFTAIFIVPLVALLRAGPLPLAPRGIVAHALAASRARPVLLALCLGLAAFTAGEQFYRNFAYTGRLLGVSEILARWTDRAPAVLAPLQGTSVFDVAEHRGPREKYVRTLVHVLTLDRWIVPEELGFHLMPTSRLIAVAVVLALLMVALPGLRRRRHALALGLVWTVCAAAMLDFFSQGRYLLPLSFGAAFVVAYLVGELWRDARPEDRGWLGRVLCVALGLAAIGDQVVGSFINDGWDCRRKIAAAVEPSNYDRPREPLERRLEDIARRYRAAHGPLAVPPPTIVCQDSVGRLHYLGTHYIYTTTSVELTPRMLAAQPGKARLLPRALLAVCFKDRAFFEWLVPPAQRASYVEAEGAGNVHIMVSKPLMDGKPPATLIDVPHGRLFGPTTITDFVADWDQGWLADGQPAQTPSGKGAYAGQATDGTPVGVLLSPYRITFENVEYHKGDRLVLDLAMPYSNSDGMDVEVTMTGRDEVPRSVRMSLPPKPAASPGPRWERHDIDIPPGVEGMGTVSLTGSSPSGDVSGDWVFVRRMELAH
jgi:hypothetical protein